MKWIAQIAIGIVLLAVACWIGIYSGIYLTAFTLGILGGVGMFISAALPLGVAVFLILQAARGRPAYAAAPVLFFCGWALTSVGIRQQLSLEAAKFAPPAIDHGLVKNKTLIVDDFLNFSRTFVTEGVVDRLVEISYEGNNRSKPIRSIRQTTLARGQECSDADKQRSSLLRAAGRTEECLKETTLSEIPDGLQILYPQGYFWGPGWPGPLTATVVDGERKTDALTWRRIAARVPAYLPFFRMNSGPFDRAATIWESRQGPFELVSYGDLDLRSQTMAAAIFGFDPSRPPKPEQNLALVAKRASDLASAGDYGAALSNVTLLDKANFLDDNMIKAAAYNIFVNVNSNVVGGRLPSLRQFSDKLSNQQRALLNGEIIRILTTPRKCYCRAFLFDSKELGQMAIDAFQNAADLELWQYNGLLTATMYISTPFEQYRSALLSSIMVSHDQSNARRIVAYLYKADWNLRDDDMRALTAKLTELDADGIYLMATQTAGFHSPSQIAKFHKSFDPEIAVRADTWNAFWSAMRVHASRIAEPDRQERAIEGIAKMQQES